MNGLEHAAALLRAAMTEYIAADADLNAFEANIETLQGMVAGKRERRDAAARAVKAAREKLYAAAVPKETPTP